jgi:hypothetical protein
LILDVVSTDSLKMEDMSTPGAFALKRQRVRADLELTCPCCYRPGNPLCDAPATSLSAAQKLEAIRGLMKLECIDAYVVVRKTAALFGRKFGFSFILF